MALRIRRVADALDPQIPFRVSHALKLDRTFYAVCVLGAIDLGRWILAFLGMSP
jgi:hypothetical protein